MSKEFKTPEEIQKYIEQLEKNLKNTNNHAEKAIIDGKIKEARIELRQTMLKLGKKNISSHIDAPTVAESKEFEGQLTRGQVMDSGFSGGVTVVRI